MSSQWTVYSPVGGSLFVHIWEVRDLSKGGAPAWAKRLCGIRPNVSKGLCRTRSVESKEAATRRFLTFPKDGRCRICSEYAVRVTREKDQ